MQKIKTRKRRSMSKSLRHFSGTREAPGCEMHDCTKQRTQRTQWRGTQQQADAIDINWHELAQHCRFLKTLLTYTANEGRSRYVRPAFQGRIAVFTIFISDGRWQSYVAVTEVREAVSWIKIECIGNCVLPGHAVSNRFRCYLCFSTPKVPKWYNNALKHEME